MLKWFVILTVLALCFLGVFAQNDTHNVTYPAEASDSDATDEPTYAPTNLQDLKDDHIGNITSGIDEDTTNKQKHPSTFPPLVHNANPHTHMTTEEPPKTPISIDATQNNKVPVPTTTEMPTTTTMKPKSTNVITNNSPGKQTDSKKNSSNTQQGSLIVLGLSLLVFRFSY